MTVIDETQRAVAADLDDALYAGWNSRAPEAIAALFADEARYYSPTIPQGHVSGRAAIAQELEGMFGAFPDFSVAREDRWIAEDGRSVAIYWTVTATFSGVLAPPGFAPTNERLSMRGMSRIAIRHDQITEIRIHFDLNELGRKIGALPAPGSFGERMAVRLQSLKARGRRRQA